MENDQEINTLKKYNQMYLEIIMRYKDHIEENENLNVAELPKLIAQNDKDVLSVAGRIKSSFPTYNYEENFPSAAKFAYEYVKTEIANMSLPIEFWLTPSQTIKIGAGDVFDRAILLCSVLIALGNVSTKVVISVTSNERKFVVYSEFENKVLVFDVEDGYMELNNKDELLDKLGIKKNEETTAYEFNDKMYNDLV